MQQPLARPLKRPHGPAATVPTPKEVLALQQLSTPDQHGPAPVRSLRLRTGGVVLLLSLLLVMATDALHLRHQAAQRSLAFEAELQGLPNTYGLPLARSMVSGAASQASTQQLIDKLQARPGVLAVELKTPDGAFSIQRGDRAAQGQADVREILFELGPPAAGGATLQVLAREAAMQEAFWRETLPGSLARDAFLVVLLSLGLMLVLDRMMLRPLRRLADSVDALDPDHPPAAPALSPLPQQPAELMRIARSLARVQQSLWQQLQEERSRVQALEGEAQQQRALLADASLALEQKSRELGSLSRHDSLTGLANRREFDEALRREFKRAQRQRGQLALAVLDLDHFKNYNERYGQAAGDLALKRFAQLLSERFKRDTDLVARLGGEEFVALLPGFGLDTTQELLEQVREDLRALQLPHEGGVSGPVLTVSVGLAAYSAAHPYLSPLALMQAADEALYIAKHAGRDRLSLASASSLGERV